MVRRRRRGKLTRGKLTPYLVREYMLRDGPIAPRQVAKRSPWYKVGLSKRSVWVLLDFLKNMPGTYMYEPAMPTSLGRF